MAEKLKEYKVGDYTFQLNDEDAKRLKAEPVTTKSATPSNKARQSTSNKAGAKPDTSGIV